MNPRDDDGIVVLWSVYILRCGDGTLYVGETGNLERRLITHAAGGSRYTAIRRPVVLVYVEALAGRTDALNRERQIKRWTRAKKEALIAGDHQRLKALAKRR